MPFIGFIVTCQWLAGKGTHCWASPQGRWHWATLHYLHTFHTGQWARPHWQQLHFFSSASAPSPPLHTQSLAHFSHSAGQQEQQPADKMGNAQSDGLSSPTCPHQKEGGKGGVPEVTAPHFLVLHLGWLSISGVSATHWAPMGERSTVTSPQPHL